jgi:hypothetical protein
VLTPGGQPQVQLEGREVTGLARDGATRWAVSGGQELWRSDASGAWIQIAVAPPGLKLRSLAVSAAGLLVGTSEARLLRLESERLEPVASFDAIEDREKWYTPWGGPPDSRSIAVDPAGTIYVNVHVGGIPRSRDGGRSWEPTIDVDSDVHQVLTVDRRPGLVLAASAQGLARSDDAGDSWTFHTEGLHGSYCRAIAVAGETLLVSASEGHRGRRAALYRRPLEESGPFARCEVGLPGWFGSNIDSNCLAASGREVAFGTDEGEVYLSADAAETWTGIGSGLPPVRSVAFE